MSLDKQLYQKSLRYYAQWNEAELAYRIQNRGGLSPEEAWQQYVALVELCWELCPEQSERQQREKLTAIDRYYTRLKRLEAWRRQNGKAP